MKEHPEVGPSPGVPSAEVHAQTFKPAALINSLTALAAFAERLRFKVRGPSFHRHIVPRADAPPPSPP